MRTINGIDIWENGEPNRPYRVIGIIDDSTLESNGAQPGTLDILSVASAVSLGSRDNRLVSEAKKHGADAIVALNLDRSFLGANQYQSNFKQVLKIAAIHYLDSFPKPTFQIGDSRTTIESLVEKTANIPFEAIAKAFKVILSEQEMATCRCSGYVVNGNPMAVLYMSDKAKLIMLIKSAGKFTDAEVTNFLSAFAERSEWNRIPKKKLVDWRRIDGLRWACRFTQTNDVQEWFARRAKLRCTASKEGFPGKKRWLQG